MSSIHVEQLQVLLREAGHDIKVDGDFGMKTLDAVMAELKVAAPPPPLPGAVPTPGEGDPPPHPSPAAMSISDDGIIRLRQREGCVLHAYQDTKGVWTIGVGHTTAAGEPKVVPGLSISQAQADHILHRDLAQFEKAVNDAVEVPLKQHEYDALVSLAFNIGIGAFKGSTVVKRLNVGANAVSVATAIMMWDQPKEIISRRKTEMNQYLGK